MALIECSLECGDLGELDAFLYIDYDTDWEGRGPNTSLLVTINKWRIEAVIGENKIDVTDLVSEYLIDDLLDNYIDSIR